MAVQPVPRVNPDIRRAFGLPKHIYVDPGHYAWEREHIFARTWQYAGPSERVAHAGDYITLQIAGEPVLVVRGKDERLRAFYNVCPHRGSVLASGEGSRKVIQCPYHAWTFGLDGCLLHARNFEEAEDFDKADFPLTEIRAEAWGPFLFVCLDPGAPALATEIADIQAEMARVDLSALVPAKHLQYEIGANWKIVIDNFLECYHCAVAHPSFIDMIDMSGYTIEIKERYSVQRGPVKGTDEESLFYWVWPNFMLNAYPGPGISINHIQPLGLDKTLAVFDLYFPDRELDEKQLDLVAFIDQVQKEDTWLCENVQAGMGSRAFSRGRFAPEEVCVHHFHTLMESLIPNLD